MLNRKMRLNIFFWDRMMEDVYAVFFISVDAFTRVYTTTLTDGQYSALNMLNRWQNSTTH